MLYVQREQGPASARFARKFAWKKEFDFPFHTLLITLFGRTWRISWSGRYAFVETQMRCQLDALTQAFVAQTIEQKTGQPLRAFTRLSTGGKSTDFYFKGDLDGTPIFVKTAFTGWKKDLEEGDTVLSNEFAKGRLLAALSPHFVAPLYYFNCFPCEILISPLLENAETLISFTPRSAEEFDWIAEQVRAIQTLLTEQKLAHRDVQESNFVIGSLNGQEPRLFLTDLAFMKRTDGPDTELPPALDRAFLRIVRRENDDGAFEAMLERLRARMR